MSLHKFAEQVAANGRGDDSLLVHMTPDEVQRLQSFAEANGRSLTINPTTGLPEAGMLSDLFKAVAPIALGAFLGPAGFGLSATMAGVATGGITALATGSLSRGLMAGLGAYGGAGLGESFMNAGSASLASTAGATAGAEATQQGLSEAARSQAIDEAVRAQGYNEAVGKTAATDVFGAGAKAAAANPMAFAKQNLGNLAYAAAPIAAGLMVPTTTKMPDPKDTGYIRQMAYNINPDTGRPDPLYGRVEMAPVKASEFGNKTFQGQRDLFYKQNQNPYELGVGSLNQPPQQQQQPPRMNTGGIVALAGGGVSDADIFKYFQTPNLSDTQIAADMQKYGVSAADIARATGTQNQQADYEKRFVNTLIAPGTDASEFQKATGAVGLKDQSLATAMQNAGLSQGAQYALTQPAQNDIGFTGGIIDSGTGKAVDLYNQIGYTAGKLPGDQGGLEGLYGNINYVASGLQNLINTGKMSVADAQNAALAELARTKVSVADVKAATGKDFGNLFMPKKIEEEKKPITPLPFTNVIPGGYYGNNTGNTLTRTPGDITTNPDGTVTVTPNIPGRPTGGFTGMGQVKDVYTAGGGSLGYTSPVVKTAAEHNAAYNKMTDDSLDAYNFLMGKGKNLTQRKAETQNRPVMQRYDEAVLGRKMGKPVATTATTKTDTKETVAGDTAVVGGVNFDLTDPTKAPAEDNNGPWSWDVGSKRWVQYGRFADGGMTGYAVGGGIGSLGSYSDGGRLLKGPGDGVSDSIPATIGAKNQPARLADGEFVIPARIVSELGNGSTDAGAKKLYAMMDRVQRARGKTTGKNKVAANSRADKYLPA